MAQNQELKMAITFDVGIIFEKLNFGILVSIRDIYV